MTTNDPKSMLMAMVQPWHEAIADPAIAQANVLQNMLRDYVKTGYGAEHGASHLSL